MNANTKPTPYADAAQAIQDSGIGSPLPVPTGAKQPPPSGYTGANGRVATQTDIDGWIDTRSEANIATRFAPDVIGVDVDAYGNKTGDDTLAKLIDELGPLPPTWMTTSRDDGSGILLYRLPDDVDEAVLPEGMGPGIDTIRHSHRYAMTAPSVHPNGGIYGWYQPSGDAAPANVVPELDDLPEFPRPWCDHFGIVASIGAGELHQANVDDDIPAGPWTVAQAHDGRAGTAYNRTFDGPRDIAEMLVAEYGYQWPTTRSGVVDDRPKPVVIDGEPTTRLELVRPGKQAWQGHSAAVLGSGSIWVYSTDPEAAPPTVERNRGYDPFGWIVAHDHGGDFKAAARAVGEHGDASANGGTKHADIANITSGNRSEVDRIVDALIDERLVWDDLWAHDGTQQAWAVPQVVPEGRLVAIYAEGKAGKSLLMLDVAAAIASGRSVLGQPAQPPRHVTYLDYEMTLDDVQDRLLDLGYDETADLSRFHYHRFPNMPELDTEDGGAVLAALIEREGSSLVVVDTLIRAVQGNEQESETYARAARHSWTPLKRDGVTVVRLDHAGKDARKGQRGSSAKRDDVDVVWRLVDKGSGKVELKLDASRVSWVAQRLDVERETDPLRHTLPAQQAPDAATAVVIGNLDALNVPKDASVRAAGTALKDVGQGAKGESVRRAVAWRKAHPDEMFWDSDERDTPRDTPPDEHRDTPSGHAGTHSLADTLESSNSTDSGSGHTQGHTRETS